VWYFATSGNICSGPASNSWGITTESGYTIIHTFREVSNQTASTLKWYSTGGALLRGIFAHATWSDGNYYFDQGETSSLTYQRMSYAVGDHTFRAFNTYALVNSTTDRSMYMNGIKRLTSNVATQSLTLATTPASIANITGSTLWDARLTNFLVYNRPLGDAEIQEVTRRLRLRYGTR
jgi:hypothetical protein